MDNNEEIKDVDFEDLTEDKNIRGKALYYSTLQVATILGESDSKIRYYSNVFGDILNIEISNKQRRYKQSDIDKLKFIIELKNEGMTLKQIKEYCEEVNFDENGAVIVKESNPLGIKALAQALMEEQTKQIELMKVDILEELKEFVKEQSINNEIALDRIKEEISITIDDSVSEKLDNAIEELKETFKIGYVTKEEIYKNQNKSWFSRLFNK